MTERVYDRTSPFMSQLLCRQALCSDDVSKQTYHLELDLGDSQICYEVGDCIGVLPSNDPLAVERVLEALKARGDELVLMPNDKGRLSFKEALLTQLNLSTVTRKLIELLSTGSHSALLKPLLDPSNRAKLKEFSEQYEVWDFLVEFGSDALSSEALVAALQPMLPRFYSIASHQKTVGSKVDLIVAYTSYATRGIERAGVASHYLCRQIDVGRCRVPIYLQPNKGFTLPEDPSADIIMIGAGTGVAPYRGFMQKRLWQANQGRSWLFFGEKHEKKTFFYRDFWLDLVNSGRLKLTCAFSRDQEEKVYVQDCLYEQRHELYHWLQSGAYLFLCGDAQQMAKAVEATLLKIFCELEAIEEKEAAFRLRQLYKEGRYRKDVY